MSFLQVSRSQQPWPQSIFYFHVFLFHVILSDVRVGFQSEHVIRMESQGAAVACVVMDGDLEKTIMVFVNSTNGRRAWYGKGWSCSQTYSQHILPYGDHMALTH